MFFNRMNWLIILFAILSFTTMGPVLATEPDGPPVNTKQISESEPNSLQTDFSQISHDLKLLISQLNQQEAVHFSPWNLNIGMTSYEAAEAMPASGYGIGSLRRFQEFYEINHGPHIYEVRLLSKFWLDPGIYSISIEKQRIPFSHKRKSKPAMAEKPQAFSSKVKPVSLQPWGIQPGMTLEEVDLRLPPERSYDTHKNQLIYILKEGKYSYKLTLSLRKKDSVDRVHKMDLEDHFDLSPPFLTFSPPTETTAITDTDSAFLGFCLTPCR